MQFVESPHLIFLKRCRDSRYSYFHKRTSTIWHHLSAHKAAIAPAYSTTTVSELEQKNCDAVYVIPSLEHRTLYTVPPIGGALISCSFPRLPSSSPPLLLSSSPPLLHQLCTANSTDLPLSCFTSSRRSTSMHPAHSCGSAHAGSLQNVHR